MKTKRYEHGTAFEETFSVKLRGEVEGQPCGLGGAGHESKWLQDQLHQAIRDAIGRFYQCQLYGTSVEVTL